MTRARGLKFPGSNGSPPQTQARRYVYRVIASMLRHELHPDSHDGWMFGGVEHVDDQKRVAKAIKAVRAEMLCRGQARPAPGAVTPAKGGE